ncbi:MAG: hypothetical protein SCALA702_32250 [Melioribacteraceae bacterium]|nr:MAG: hypothetical protein SCALA702_32250 [Melioribacteraceae bacterium]
MIYPFFDSPYSNILYAHPLNFKAVATGLEVGYTSEHIFVANDFLYPYDKQLTVGVSGLSASEATTKHYGDWTVTASWEDGQKSMEATIGHGLPYAFFKITGGDAIITPAQSPNVWHHQNEVLGITVNNKHYGIFAPTGSVWSITSILQSSLNGEDFLSIALLPDADPATLELFRSHAYAFVTNSKVDWVFNESTSELTCEYIYETELKDTNPGNSDQTLTALYRHHWLNTTNPLLNYTYQSPRGIMKLSEGNTFSTKLMYSGILPALPDEGNYNRSVLLSFIEEVAGETLPVGPTYENGKAMARFANIVHIADQLGATEERDYLLNQLKTRLEEWFTAGGEQEYSYINSWDVMTGYPSGYGADNQINDHHFHASYAIVSAATIAMYDSTWAARDNWGGMVNMLIRDANSWDRNDDMFPFLRSFDAYAGHSWAAGHGDFAEGNNQESSSESMNFASATALWGEVTNQTEIRDLGIFLHTTEASALDQYWFDVDEEVFPQDYPHVAIGMVWGGKGVHSTWFGADPEFIHGINLLPITSGSLYLGRDPEYVLTNYNEVVEERNGQPIVWKDIFWEYLALADPDLAISYYYADSAYTPFDGESRAHTYHWLYNLKKMGHVETSVFADIATFAVFRDSEGYLTYVAYNANSQERLVTFSDGFTMTVAPKKLEAISTSPADPNAPVVLLLADKSSGKVPLNVGFTGSYSFDPNGSPLTYKWDFGDGTTAFTADTSHVFTEVGTYDVSLTITNDLNLTTTDNMTIEVLGNGTPYNGTAISIPGIVQAEFYDLGGEGVAYHDVDAVNWGVPFRSDEGVDIEASNDVGGGYNIGWIEDGEWVEYTIDVPEAGLYNVVPLISSVPGGGGIHIEFNGIDLTGVVSVPVTGGWQFWEELVIPDVYLDAGEQIMHVEFHSGQFNLNWIELRASTTDLEGQQTLPQNFELKQNYPNPFNPVTKIEFALTVSSNVEIILYNLLGQQVSKIASGKYSAGYHNVRFNGANLSSGLYIYRIKAVGDNNKEFNDSKKMILLK